MSALLLEAVGHEEEANLVYDKLKSENLIDFEVRKRKIASLRFEGQADECIKELNKYVTENPNDGETWLELADIYMEGLNY